MFLEFVNENLWLFGALALIVNLLLFSLLQGTVKGAQTVSPLEMPALQRKGKSVVIDVNKPEHFTASHIPNSISIPLDEISGDNKELLKHKDRTVVISCQTGSLSIKAAKQLVAHGFSDVHILRGGLMAWSKENLPLKSN